MANELKVKNGLIVEGNITTANTITASAITASNGFFGTASWAVSASWAPSGLQVTAVPSASWASASYTASFLTPGIYNITGLTSSLSGNVTGSMFGTASWATSAGTANTALGATSASFASASYTASFLSAGQYNVTGITASLNGNQTGSMFGTASWATSAGTANTAFGATSASWASASYTASFLSAGQYNVTGITASLNGNQTGSMF